MKTIAHSNIAKRFGAMLAIGLAGAVLAGSITPVAAHKHGGGKPAHPMQNEGVPKPQPARTIGEGQWHATPTPPVVRDHRTAPVVRDHRVVTRDHRNGNVPTTKGRTGSRGKTPCLGNLCNVKVCTASVCF